MAGLGLTNALQSYQQGVQWRQQQDLIAEQKAKKDKINAANQAGTGYIEEAKQAHEAEQAAALQEYTKNKGSTEGFQATPFRPNDKVMFGAAARRGDALLNAGLFDEYAQNRAAIIPMQIQSRQAAWQKFQTDGDHGALGAAMYDTIPDGKHVKSYDVLDGAGPDGKKAGKKIRFHLDDGTIKMFSPEEVEGMAMRAAMNPQELAKVEFERDLIAAKAREAQALEKLKAAEDRKTKKMEIDGKAGLAVLNHDREDSRAEADRKSAERQTGARVSATRYSADQGVAAAKVRTKGAGKDDRTKAFSDLHDEVRKTVGKQAMGAFGGTKMADEDTLNMARYAEALMDNDESLGSGDAISKAVAEFKKRKPTTTDAEE